MDLFGDVKRGKELTELPALITKAVARRVACPICELVVKLPDNNYHCWDCPACLTIVEVLKI